MAKSWNIDEVEFVNKNIEREGIYNIRGKCIPKIYNSVGIKIQQPIISTPNLLGDKNAGRNKLDASGYRMDELVQFGRNKLDASGVGWMNWYNLVGFAFVKGTYA